jgi:RNA polymerase sigma-70 factor (ECF subfamily)
VSSEPDDESLMQAFAGGDAAAFEVLYRRHRTMLIAFLMRSLGRRDQAEDCFQEVWSRVVSARAGYRAEARFSTWLLQIAHNLVVDRFRRQRPEVAIDEVAEAALGEDPALPGPEATLSAFERQRQLRAAIAALPPEQRHAVLLRLDQELSLEAIGQVTGVGRETVKSRLRYGLDKLRELLT